MSVSVIVVASSVQTEDDCYSFAVIGAKPGMQFLRLQ